MRPIARSAFALALSLIGAAACSSSKSVASQYQLDFPSTQAAVGAQTIQVFVFDAGTAGADCTSLVITRKSGGQLPATIAQTDPASLCDAFNGTHGQLPAISFGSRSFLAVAQVGTVDYYVGCAVVSVDANAAPVEIAMQPTGKVNPPPSMCASVSDKCRNACM